MRALVVATVLAGVLVAATSVHAEAGAPAGWRFPEPRPCARETERPLRAPTSAYGAVAKGRLTAYERPDGRPARTFSRVNANGYPTVFGVLSTVVTPDCRRTWYRVQLPIRPNGSTGYVRATSVRLIRVRKRIDVDLSRRRIDVFEAGRRVLSIVAAIGAPSTPTPTGSYYVNQLILASDPAGSFGPGAIGISAFSPTLQDWAQGGPIAIHGTNAPSLIGEAVSLGCLRIANRTLERLLWRTPPGTPVVIHP